MALGLLSCEKNDELILVETANLLSVTHTSATLESNVTYQGNGLLNWFMDATADQPIINHNVSANYAFAIRCVMDE